MEISFPLPSKRVALIACALAFLAVGTLNLPIIDNFRGVGVDHMTIGEALWIQVYPSWLERYMRYERRHGTFHGGFRGTVVALPASLVRLSTYSFYGALRQLHAMWYGEYSLAVADDYKHQADILEIQGDSIKAFAYYNDALKICVLLRLKNTDPFLLEIKRLYANHNPLGNIYQSEP